MTSEKSFLRVPHAEMLTTFYNTLIRYGTTEEKAKACAEIFTTNSLEGIYTHGVNRFPRFVNYIKGGFMDMKAVPSRTGSMGAVEQWNGNSGPGPLNALFATKHSMQLAREHGIGCVALANTNHWMRGGFYGGYAAKAGFAFIGWTNTVANMPAWGAVDGKLGNNPLIVAVPYKEDGIVLDMAMSQYSYGALELYSLKNEKLPTPGGYDQDGNLTNDPDAIGNSRRVLPIGFWKGAGLSLLLDILGATLANGLSSHQISKEVERGLSQVFITINMAKLGNFSAIQNTIQQIIDDYHASKPVRNVTRVRYPGERLAQIRSENMTQGIPVSSKIWQEILSL